MKEVKRKRSTGMKLPPTVDADLKKLLLKLAKMGAPRPGSQEMVEWLMGHEGLQDRYLAIGNWLIGQYLDGLTTEERQELAATKALADLHGTN